MARVPPPLIIQDLREGERILHEQARMMGKAADKIEAGWLAALKALEEK